MSKDPCPPLSAFRFLPDRDWNREWEAACSLTGGGRGGRDPRVTIALGQQFRAFAGAVAGAALRANLQPATTADAAAAAPPADGAKPGGGDGGGTVWIESLAPLQPMAATKDGDEGKDGKARVGGGGGRGATGGDRGRKGDDAGELDYTE